ncbi:hypothetical protein DL770_009861 [Monosporascus sp. CRB-9-2]|nr:hypothetical protein DL770_009861 [Monosporascus sp. CRB-9-2]
MGHKTRRPGCGDGDSPVAKIFRTGRQYVADTLNIWSLTILGEEMYVVSSPNDVLLVYREPIKLDADFAVKDVLADFGVTPDNIAKIFDRNGTPKHWMDYCHEHFKSQMHPGERFNILQEKFLGNIDASLQWDRISGNMLLSNSTTSKTVSLWKWCHEVLVNSATLSFFGKAIYRVCPTIVPDFFIFDADAWKLPYRYPKFAAREMYDAKARGETAFAEFLALPAEERQDASWIVNTIRDGLSGLGVDDPKQCGAMLFSLHRVVNSNAYRLCFWSLAFLLHDPRLLSIIKEEIKPALKDDGGPDMHYLVENCPLLASFYEEILRWTNDPISIRLVTEEVTIGRTTLKPGRKLIMPYRPMHYDKAIFGENASEFDAGRFLNNKGLYRSTSWHPFGGGAMYCPGRFIAKREVYMFVVLALSRFDMELVSKNGKSGKQKFPTLDETIPAGGILPPIPEDDVIVRLRKAGAV